MNENAYTKLDQEDYKKRYETLISRYETVKARHDEIIDNMQKAKVHQDKTESFLSELRKQDGLIDEFNENLWLMLLDAATINVDDIIFTFKNGMEISINQSGLQHKCYI